MQIWGSRTSPYVRKTRVFAIERGVPFEFVDEDPWQKSERLLALNPLGKVPVLALDDGRVFYDSLAIIQVLDEVGPDIGKMLPESGPDYWEVMRWHALTHGIVDAVVNRLLETRRPEKFQMADRMTREEVRFDRTLSYVSTNLDRVPKGRSDGPGFNELMLGVALKYADFRYSDAWRAAYPRLSDFADRLAEHQSFRETDPRS